MQVVMTALRSLFLVFLVAFAARGLPFFLHQPRTFDEQYSMCANNLGILEQAVAYAAGWLVLESVVGWVLFARARTKAKLAKATAQKPNLPTA